MTFLTIPGSVLRIFEVYPETPDRTAMIIDIVDLMVMHCSSSLQYGTQTHNECVINVYEYSIHAGLVALYGNNEELNIRAEKILRLLNSGYNELMSIMVDAKLTSGTINVKQMAGNRLICEYINRPSTLVEET